MAQIRGEERLKLTALCGSVFSPSAPVDRLTLFAGRQSQIRKISEAISARGRHCIVYGERGVGKTSLASILPELFRDQPGTRIVKINCAESDTFKNVWTKALAEVPAVVEAAGDSKRGFQSTEYRLSDYIEQFSHFGPGEVRRLLNHNCQDHFELVLVFDEFDTLRQTERALFADTIKDLSDNSIRATVVMVGVARNVVELIEDHASIDRCVTQILMPPMSQGELRDIIDKAMATLKMTIASPATNLIVGLAQGLPHYTHLLTQSAAYIAIDDSRRHIAIEDVNKGMDEAIDKIQETVKSDYHRAADGQRRGTLFPQVLLACALAEVDALGYFRSTDVRGPLREITGKDYEIPNFAQHLDKFSSDPSRGGVLEKWGEPRRYSFRFKNPLLKPFVIMKGLRTGEITGELFGRIAAAADQEKLRTKRGTLF